MTTHFHQISPELDSYLHARGLPPAYVENIVREAVLEDLDDGKKMSYQIVGDDEADIAANKISISSPIARALIGKEEGDVVSVQAPAGAREVEILSVRYI